MPIRAEQDQSLPSREGATSRTAAGVGLKKDRQGQAWVRVARARRGLQRIGVSLQEQSGYKARVRNELRGRRLPHGTPFIRGWGVPCPEPSESRGKYLNET